MSVLVKGMKMPESCHECVAGYGGFCFVASAESDGICPDHGRPDDCPLIELPAEHGRLIDAYELEKAHMKYLLTVDKPTEEKEQLYQMARIVVQQPTIIEAEEE